MRSFFRRIRQRRRGLDSSGSPVENAGTWDNDFGLGSFDDHRSGTVNSDPLDYKLVELEDIDGVTPISWSPSSHYLYPAKVRTPIKAFLLIVGRKSNGDPFHPEVPWFQLPKQIVMLICRFIAGTKSGYHYFPSITRIGDFKVNVPRPIRPLSVASPQSCDTFVLKYKVGCMRCPPGALSIGLCCGKYYFCFHPGFNWPNGAFRAPRSETEDDVSQSHNLDMGWSPQQEKLHEWVVVIRREGQNEICVTDADGIRQFKHKWNAGPNFIADGTGNITICRIGLPQNVVSDIRVWLL